MDIDKEREELLPCPFCGETEGLMIQHCEGTIIHPALRIYCDNCGASSGYSDRVDPVENWNRRAALQSQSTPSSEWFDRFVELLRQVVAASQEFGVLRTAESFEDSAAATIALQEHARKHPALQSQHETQLQVWRSTDSCGEFWSWDEADQYDYDRAKPENRRVIQIIKEG